MLGRVHLGLFLGRRSALHELGFAYETQSLRGPFTHVTPEKVQMRSTPNARDRTGALKNQTQFKQCQRKTNITHIIRRQQTGRLKIQIKLKSNANITQTEGFAKARGRPLDFGKALCGAVPLATSQGVRLRCRLATARLPMKVRFCREG